MSLLNPNLTFLLADDDRDDAELFGEALGSLNPPVKFIHVENGHGVFSVLNVKKEIKPDIIFLDLNMPELSGWQCLARLKNDVFFKDIPVIMYSTSSNARDREIAIELGATGFITKPSSFNTLISILTDLASTPIDELKSKIRDLATNSGF
jgi:CheY-like chemotaxis protein